MFWDHLKNFWSKETVATWEATLFPRGLSETGDERVDNLMVLSKTAHVYWNRGAFALKPLSISDNNTTLKVQFFWQKKQTDIQATMSLLTEPHSTKDLDQNEGAFDHHGHTRLRYPDDIAIKSGDIFELKTTDPINQPLPNFTLLELQWALARVIGMAGAAFPYESTDGDDLDDDGPGLDLARSIMAGVASPYEPTDGDDSDYDVPGLDLDEVGDMSLISDSSNSPEFLRQVDRRLAESVKSHQSKLITDETETDKEEVEDGRDRGRRQVAM